jgi:hypothetical protein
MRGNRLDTLKLLLPLVLLLGIAVAAGPQTSARAPAKPADKCCAKKAGDYPGEGNRHFVTVRGEIVDYYCYIEKGLTGPGHRDCGTRCVAGDVCMGILTTDKQLYMISVNHLRAMDPLSFRNIPDPFTTCRGWVSETVDLGGYAMERRGQKIIEIASVKKATGPPPAGDPQAKLQ